MPSATNIFSADNRPKFGEEYEVWLAQNHDLVSLSSHRNNYLVVSRELRDNFMSSAFWQNFLPDLKEIDDSYAISFKYPLIATFAPEVLIKPWDSFFEKSYRKNISQNTNFPD